MAKEGNSQKPLMRMSFVLPVEPGKEEAWRRFLQELGGSRLEDFERARRRLGIGEVQVWLQRTRWGAMAVVHVEVDDPARALSALADSDGPFERWLKRGIEEFHGVDVDRERPRRMPEPVFRSGPAGKG